MYYLSKIEVRLLPMELWSYTRTPATAPPVVPWPSQLSQNLYRQLESILSQCDSILQETRTTIASFGQNSCHRTPRNSIHHKY